MSSDEGYDSDYRNFLHSSEEPQQQIQLHYDNENIIGINDADNDADDATNGSYLEDDGRAAAGSHGITMKDMTDLLATISQTYEEASTTPEATTSSAFTATTTTAANESEIPADLFWKMQDPRGMESGKPTMRHPNESDAKTLSANLAQARELFRNMRPLSPSLFDRTTTAQFATPPTVADPTPVRVAAFAPVPSSPVEPVPEQQRQQQQERASKVEPKERQEEVKEVGTDTENQQQQQQQQQLAESTQPVKRSIVVDTPEDDAIIVSAPKSSPVPLPSPPRQGKKETEREKPTVKDVQQETEEEEEKTDRRRRHRRRRRRRDSSSVASGTSHSSSVVDFTPTREQLKDFDAELHDIFKDHNAASGSPLEQASEDQMKLLVAIKIQEEELRILDDPYVPDTLKRVYGSMSVCPHNRVMFRQLLIRCIDWFNEIIGLGKSDIPFLYQVTSVLAITIRKDYTQYMMFMSSKNISFLSSEVRFGLTCVYHLVRYYFDPTFVAREMKYFEDQSLMAKTSPELERVNQEFISKMRRYEKAAALKSSATQSNIWDQYGGDSDASSFVQSTRSRRLSTSSRRNAESLHASSSSSSSSEEEEEEKSSSDTSSSGADSDSESEIPSKTTIAEIQI